MHRPQRSKRGEILKQLSIDISSFILVNAILILVWMIIDDQTVFWPKYVLVIWGAAIVFKAYRLKLFPFFKGYISFLNPEWEDKKVKELTQQRRFQQHKINLVRYGKK